MDDLISRQAVIDIALQYCPDDDGACSKAGHDPREMLDEIEQLPSAQLEIITCNECNTLKRSVCIWHNAGATYCSFAEN